MFITFFRFSVLFHRLIVCYCLNHETKLALLDRVTPVIPVSHQRSLENSLCTIWTRGTTGVAFFHFANAAVALTSYDWPANHINIHVVERERERVFNVLFLFLQRFFCE